MHNVACSKAIGVCCDGVVVAHAIVGCLVVASMQWLVVCCDGVVVTDAIVGGVV